MREKKHQPSLSSLGRPLAISEIRFFIGRMTLYTWNSNEWTSTGYLSLKPSDAQMMEEHLGSMSDLIDVNRLNIGSN